MTAKRRPKSLRATMVAIGITARTPRGVADIIESLRAQIVERDRELERARRDVYRMNYLETLARDEVRIRNDGTVSLDRWRRRYVSFWRWSGRSLRECIDAAQQDGL